MALVIAEPTRLFVTFSLTICTGRGYDEKGLGVLCIYKI